MNEPTTLEEALAIIESLKLCANCMHFRTKADREFCTFGLSEEEIQGIYCKTEYLGNYDGICENWEMQE